MKRVFLLYFIISCIPAWLSAQTDYSNSDKIKIEQPKLARVNITGVDQLPTTKTDDLHAWLEYSDENGVYFKKRIILNAQGATSLQYPKKNLSIDFCEDEWVGDNTTSIQIGNWVKQDGFHFKANWIDSFRGGLAVATAYKFYDDIVADEEPILKRAGLTDYSSKALCHPDGFPCIISLNGEFQGVYAWQLKKHRKNMDMDKDNPKHVWFQIDSNQASLDSCRIIWDGVDVKNPKVLTDESKQYMEHLAGYNKELDSLQRICSIVKMRQEIAKRFDVASLIDYMIHGLITSNIDGFDKNINFFTYDGVKWFATPYDLDETFGNSWIATFQFTAEWSYYSQKYNMLSCLNRNPFSWIVGYFWDDVQSRYAVLRKASVISTDKIMSHLIDWNERVGDDNYRQEYAKWSSCPSNGTTVIDDHWEWVKDWTLYFPTVDYSDTIVFNKDDLCGCSYRIFKATSTVKGVFPVVQTGYTDTEQRVREYLNERIAFVDEFLNYTPESGIDEITDNRASRRCYKYISRDHQLIIRKDNKTYNYLGQRVE